MDKSMLTPQILKDWALEEGFDRVGITNLAEPATGESFLAWLARGAHAGMDYMRHRTEVRLEPASIFEGARSALCVALQYYPLEGVPDPAEDLWPKVARYARGRDYHLIMGKYLRRLSRRLEDSFDSIQTRHYVDTGPVLERELAARAGLGVIGKNTNLLHPTAGSWFLLGELFLNVELEPDQALSDLCGSCTACLDACPTGALPAAFRLDSNLCISYWTIEHRGSIPEEMRGRLDGWVFGCDICQEVCPINNAPETGDHPRLALSEVRALIDLEALLAMDEETYQDRFQASAMKRAKLEGLQRNVALAMGHAGTKRYVPALIQALGSASSVVRSHAAWALGEIGGPEAIRALEAQVEVEEDPALQSDVEQAVERARM